LKQTLVTDAESIRITFDPNLISYRELLDAFFEMHTPADPRWAGTQYRSAIFVHTPEQRSWAEQAVGARGAVGRFVAVEDASEFYAAEEYHQKYIEKMTGMRSSIDASDESFWM
jgi:methionine-S-sulfoxide reductase